jgi:hypothetical protein
MSRTKSKRKPDANPRWRVKATPAALVGYVPAPDPESAIRKAAAKFDVPKALQDRLAAHRTERP